MKNDKAIGIDFGGTSIKLAVVKNSKLLTEIYKINTKEFNSPEETIDELVNKISFLRSSFPDIKAVGIGVPGMINFSKGIIYNLTNVKGWSNVSFKNIMQTKISLPVTVDNDANCMAFGEWKFGSGLDYNNVVFLTLGTGVGGGLVLNNQLYRGRTYSAGEIGQMSIDYNGKLGSYNNIGALEKYIGNKQIEEIATKIYNEANQKTPIDCSPEKLAERAYNGDTIAQKAWEEVVYYLSSALMSITYLLDPDAIIIGGGIANAGKLLFEPIKKNLNTSLPFEYFNDLKILPAKFGNTAGIIGSAKMAIDSIE